MAVAIGKLVVLAIVGGVLVGEFVFANDGGVAGRDEGVTGGAVSILGFFARASDLAPGLLSVPAVAGFTGGTEEPGRLAPAWEIGSCWPVFADPSLA